MAGRAGGKGGGKAGGKGAGPGGPGTGGGRTVGTGRSTSPEARERARGGDPAPRKPAAQKPVAQKPLAQVIEKVVATGTALAKRGAKAKAAPAGARKPEAGLKPAPQETTGRITALDLKPGELSPEMRAYFAKCEEKLGYVPNVLAAYAHDTAKLEAFAAMYNDLMLAPSGLSKLEREMIAVAVSSVNRCYYCLTAHGAAVRQLSGDPVLGEMLVMNYRAADLAPRHRAMLDFAVLVTEAPANVEAEDREVLREAGFSDRDIWDIAATASFFNMSNRMAAAVDMRPNRSYHGDARTLP